LDCYKQDLWFVGKKEMAMEKIVLVSGGSRGIGEACVRSFAEKGYKVALHYRSSSQKAEQVAADFDRVKLFKYDLSNEQACKDLLIEVKNQLGAIDILVNNAGIVCDKLATFTTPAEYDNILNTNLRSVFLLSKYASKQMIRKKSGSIINITSVVGHSGNAGQSLYAASKSAVTGFSKSLAAELAGFGIRCNCVAPGFISTEMTDRLDDKVRSDILAKIPMKRWGEAKEVASAVRFLAEDSSSYITGTTIHVNGGMFC
jgi:3-oxoacyl-[acyl-carrier protein] reductase